MSDQREQIMNGLKKAIATESDGYHFYTMAAGSIEDAKGRETFERLAREELEHMRFLERQLKSFKETGRASAGTGLGKPSGFDGENPIFSEQIKSRISEAHFEMSALSIGIQLELNSRGYYSEQSELAQDGEVKAFYGQLADWESVHYHALLRQQEALKEDYWAAGGFAPF